MSIEPTFQSFKERSTYYHPDNNILHPEILAQLKDISETALNSVLNSVDENRKHRIFIMEKEILLEEKKIDNASFQMRFGGITALISITLIIGFAVFLTISGSPREAATVVCSVVVSLAGVFLGRQIVTSKK